MLRRLQHEASNAEKVAEQAADDARRRRRRSPTLLAWGASAERHARRKLSAPNSRYRGEGMAAVNPVEPE